MKKEKRILPVRVGPAISHGQETLLGVLELKVLVLESSSINAEQRQNGQVRRPSMEAFFFDDLLPFPASTVSVGKIASLNHKAGNNAVQNRVLVICALAKT